MPVDYNEAAEWNRLLDYEEDSILRGVQAGLKEQKRRYPMLATELSPWARRLRDHLLEFRPKQYEDLKASGTLHEYVQEIVDHAAEEMSDLLQQGTPYNQALEVIKPQLFPPPERQT